jgi:hypothetical protein
MRLKMKTNITHTLQRHCSPPYLKTHIYWTRYYYLGATVVKTAAILRIIFFLISHLRSLVLFPPLPILSGVIKRLGAQWSPVLHSGSQHSILSSGVSEWGSSVKRFGRSNSTNIHQGCLRDSLELPHTLLP